MQRAAAPNRTGLPDRLKAGVETLSGMSLDGVKVHRNSPKPAQLDALAYAQGRDIHLAPGQEAHLPHEAWHVVQQAQGRVRPTMQLKERCAVNDDPRLEREADMMGAKADQAGLHDDLGGAPATALASDGGEVVQRYLIYQGTPFKTKQEVFKDDAAYKAYMAADKDLRDKYLNDLNKYYDLGDNFKEVKLSQEQILSAQKAQKLKKNFLEISLPQRLDPYPEDRTIYAPINKAILVINDGPIRFVGTDGLIGCVEVMIEYHAEKEIGYVVAHVDSHIDEDEKEIKRQLDLMLSALSEELKQKISWAEFTDKNKKAKLTLVRNNAQSSEPKLAINMKRILAESGATMRMVNSTSVALEITPEGGVYHDNYDHKPKLDYRMKNPSESDELPQKKDDKKEGNKDDNKDAKK